MDACARRNALAEAVLAAVKERRLTVTSLGRALDSTAKEKNCIKRMDRRICNEHLFREAYDVDELGAVATTLWSMVQKHGEGW